MRILQLLLVLIVTVLQGCITSAAMDAAERWTNHSLVAARQIGPNEFRAVIAIEHNRGEFDPLGGHGSQIVTRYVELQLWRMTLTEAKIITKRESNLTLKDQLELRVWERELPSILDVNFQQGSLALLPTKYNQYSEYVRTGNFDVNLSNGKVQSLPNKGSCFSILPPTTPGNEKLRRLLASDDGDYLMVLDESRKKKKATIFAPCKNTFSNLDIDYTADKPLGFSVSIDGKSVVVREHSFASNDSKNGLYRVEFYPLHRQLDYTGSALGEGSYEWQRPDDFMYDEQSKRFYWIIAPLHSDKSQFNFVTYDPVNGTRSQGFIFE